MAERFPLLTIQQDPQDDAYTEDKVESIKEVNKPEWPIKTDVAHQQDSTKNRIIDVSKIDTNAMKTFKEILKKGNISIDITLLVIGRTGQGKSALINSLIELGREIVSEGSYTDSCTETSKSYTYPNAIPGVNVTIIDTPGVQDIQNKEHKYIQEIKNQCREISLVLYCMKMTEHRFTNDDKVAMQEFYQAFGQKFWERVMFVLTFANDERLKKWDRRDQDDRMKEPLNDDTDAWEKLKRERLAGRVEHRKNELNAFVTKLLQFQHESVQSQDAAQNLKFEVLPAGYHDPKYDDIPCGVNWQCDLIAFCCNEVVKHKHRLKLAKKIALAVIIDNRGEVKVENKKRILNDEAEALKTAFEDLEFAVLYFNSLSSESIATLPEAISKADHSQLLMIALVFLSKGKTAELYGADDVAIPYEDVFNHFQKCPTPVLFFFDLAVDDTKRSSMIDDAQTENGCMPKENISAIDDMSEHSFAIADSQNEEYFNLPLHICPQKSLILAATHNSATSPVVKEFIEKLSHTSVQECFETICANNNSTTVKSIWHDTVGNNLFIVKSINDKVDTLEQKLEVYHSIWYPVRCNTIDRIEENKEEIMSIVHKERTTRIGASVANIVIGGGLTVTGIALAPFTFGGSIAISVLGGALGMAAAGASFAAFVTSKFFCNKKLKEAQEHISLDQQISLIINEEANKYNQIMTPVPSNVSESSALAFQGAAATFKGAGTGIAIAIDGTVETAGAALRTTGRVAGMALAGVSLAVTIPIDIAFIAYHSYHIHQSKNDQTGKNEKNGAVKILYNELETLFKGMCHAINEVQYEVQAEKNILKDVGCGYEIEVPVKGKERHKVTVRTIFSGPFVFPKGYTLVSAIYDITMPKLPQPATIKLEHCVDESDQTRSDLCFAIGSVDLKNKKIIFEKVERAFNGSIQQKSSCLLCILYKRAMYMQDKKSVNYAAQCFYNRKYKNVWTLNIVFTKFLYANFKHAQNRSDFQGSYYPFVFNSDTLSLDLTCFKDSHEFSGWMVSPSDEEIPDTISLDKIDTAELNEGSAKVLKKAFPSISLNVYIFDEATATDEINESFKIGGTNLSININRHKEQI